MMLTGGVAYWISALRVARRSAFCQVRFAFGAGTGRIRRLISGTSGPAIIRNARPDLVLVFSVDFVEFSCAL